MDAAEEYVRSRWGDCTTYYINGGMANSYWSVRRELDGQELCREYCGALCGDKPSWQYAYGFTLAREEEIRQVREEIALIQNVEKTTAAFIASIYVAKHIKQDAAKEHPAWQRILKARQAHLDCLLVGWKGK